MKQAQIIVYEPDDRIAVRLRPVCQANGWRLRELRRPASVTAVLHEGASLLVLRAGADLVEEMTVLERASWQYPDTAAIVIGDVQHPELTALAWDLGAAFVLLPPFSADELPELVRGVMAPRRPQ